MHSHSYQCGLAAGFTGATDIGVASYGALGHVPPDLQQFNLFSVL